MTSEIFVKKRNGRGKEPLNIDKIHSMVGYATEDIIKVVNYLIIGATRLVKLINIKLMEICLITLFPQEI